MKFIDKPIHKIKHTDMFHGQHVEFMYKQLDGTKKGHGRITEERGFVFLCSNEDRFDGMSCEVKWGFKYSYCISEPNEEFRFENHYRHYFYTFWIEEMNPYQKMGLSYNGYLELAKTTGTPVITTVQNGTFDSQELALITGKPLTASSSQLIGRIKRDDITNLYDITTGPIPAPNVTIMAIHGLKDSTDPRIMMNYTDELVFMWFAGLAGESPTFKVLSDEKRTAEIVAEISALDDGIKVEVSRALINI